MYKISFVIPTYNFGEFIISTLNSIVDEKYEDIEIIVFDGGSSDNTLQLLENFRTRFPRLKVEVSDQRGNIDIDLNKSILMATGEYVWTLSSDDLLIPGWSKHILNILKNQQPDIMLIPAVHCDIRLNPRRFYPILKDFAKGPLKAIIRTDDDLIGYIRKIRTSEGLFSFCSACIVNRDKLLHSPSLDEANGTCWRYSARLISILIDYPCNTVVLDKPYLYKRGDNDSFSKDGLVSRLKIATINWDLAVDLLAIDPLIASELKTLVKSDITIAHLLFVSQFVRNPKEKLLYDQCIVSRLSDINTRSKVWTYLLTALPRNIAIKNLLILLKAFMKMIQTLLWRVTYHKVSSGYINTKI